MRRVQKRIRFDDRRGAGAEEEILGPRYSGRRFVVAGVIGVLVVWGAVGLGFRAWKTGYRARVEAARRALRPVLAPLEGKVPPGVAAGEWADAVAAARVLLDAIAGSNLLDRARVEALRAELAARVARTRAEDAAEALAALWDDLERRGGPAVILAPRLELAATLHELARRVPPGVSPSAWAWAVVRTRALLVDLAAAPGWPKDRRRARRDDWAVRVARGRPEDGPGLLAEMWAEAQARLGRTSRPPDAVKPAPRR